MLWRSRAWGQANSSSKWTKEKVIRELKREKEELGKSPSKRDVDGSLVNATEKHFGSWNNAKEKAGLETFEFEGKRKNWSKEKIVDELKELACELGRSPVIEDDTNLAQSARDCFGSWNQAKRAAGLEVFREDLEETERTEWSKGEVIQELKSLAEKVGRTPKETDDRNLATAARQPIFEKNNNFDIGKFCYFLIKLIQE